MKKTRSFVIATTLVLLVLITTTFSAITVNAEVVTDVTGPTITEAYCDKQGQVLKPGDTVYFSFKAYDESGLRDRVKVNFYEATSYSGRSFNWVYNSSEDKYETTFTIPSSAKNGEYYISTIYMYDIHDNQTALSTHLGFRVEGSISDTKGPTITEAYCDKQGQVLKPGDTVYFSFKAYDESGLRDRVKVNFYEATSYSGRSFNWTYNSSEDKYETTFTVPSSVKMGAYYISTIYMYDVHGNQTALSTHLVFYIEPDGHVFGNWSNFDSINHKRTCSICNKIETAPHSGGTSTCTEKAKCEICNQAYGSYAAHIGGTATCISKAKCDICKQFYGDLNTNNHTAATSWTSANNQHYHVCTNGCDAKLDVANCADSDKDHKCDVCAAAMGTHEAANGKHICDYCSQTVTECVDSDKDHKCDVCSNAMGTHEAASGKHTCDYCNQIVTECADFDKDHKCDVCGKVLSTVSGTDNENESSGDKVPEPDNDKPQTGCGSVIAGTSVGAIVLISIGAFVVMKKRKTK